MTGRSTTGTPYKVPSPQNQALELRKDAAVATNSQARTARVRIWLEQGAKRCHAGDSTEASLQLNELASSCWETQLLPIARGDS